MQRTDVMTRVEHEFWSDINRRLKQEHNEIVTRAIQDTKKAQESVGKITFINKKKLEQIIKLLHRTEEKLSTSLMAA